MMRFPVCWLFGLCCAQSHECLHAYHDQLHGGLRYEALEHVLLCVFQRDARHYEYLHDLSFLAALFQVRRADRIENRQ